MKHISLLFLILSSFSLFGQQQSFFNNQLDEFQKWLEVSQISQVFHADSIQQSEKTTLYLSFVFKGEDSLKIAWNNLRKAYYNQHQKRVSEKILDTYLFLFDLTEDNGNIIITTDDSREAIKIYYQNTLQIETNFINKHSGGNLVIPIKDLKLPNTNGKISKESVDINQVKKKIKQCINDYYGNISGSWYYAVVVDDKRAYYKKAKYRVYCMKREVTQSGYFEYIEIKIEVVQKDDENIEIRYDILGKYAPYILCPGLQSSYYKSMEVYYPHEFETYVTEFEDKLRECF